MKVIDIDTLNDRINQFLRVSEDCREEEQASCIEAGLPYHSPEVQREILEWFRDQLDAYQDGEGLYGT